MWAIPTVLFLFILGPFLFAGFIVTMVVPFTILALRGKMKDPPTESTSLGQ